MCGCVNQTSSSIFFVLEIDMYDSMRNGSLRDIIKTQILTIYIDRGQMCSISTNQIVRLSLETAKNCTKSFDRYEIRANLPRLIEFLLIL